MKKEQKKPLPHQATPGVLWSREAGKKVYAVQEQLSLESDKDETRRAGAAVSGSFFAAVMMKVSILLCFFFVLFF